MYGAIVRRTSSKASTAVQRIVADVDVRPNREVSPRDRPAAEGISAFADVLGRQQRLLLGPNRDAFEQSARLVEPRPADAQRGIHVEMTVDERRRDQPAASVDLTGRTRLEVRPDLDDAIAAHTDVVAVPSVRKIGAANDQVEHGYVLAMSVLLRRPRR